MRILSIVAGIFVIAAGVWCFANPGAALASLLLILAIFMMLSGVCSAGAYFKGKKAFGAGSWLLVDGLLSFILGIAILADLARSEVVLIVFFGMWILFTGLLRCMAAIALRKLGASTWGWMLAAGALSVLCGFCMFASPLAAGFAVVYVIGVSFLIQGVSIVLNGCFLGGTGNQYR